VKRKGFLVLLIVLFSLVPVGFAQSENYLTQTNGVKIRYYKNSGYDQLLKPDDSVLVYSQRYTIEYLSGKHWKQITTPYTVTQKSEQVTRKYTDYQGTTAEVIYSKTENGLKSDVVIHSEETREYRIVWSLDGIVNENVRYGENYVEFYNGNEWLRVDWNDAYTQFGDITEYNIDESANGKKIDIIFNVGTVEAGKTLVLDPTLVSSFDETHQNSVRNIVDNHPSPTATSAVGQALNSTVTEYLYSGVFYLQKDNAPTGIAYVALYNTTGTLGTSAKPNGELLAISDGLNVTGLTGAYVLYTFNFTFTDQIQLIQGNNYSLVLLAPETGTVDAVNQIKVGISTNTSHIGNLVIYDTGAWGAVANRDCIFYLYSESDYRTEQYDRNTYKFLNITATDPDGANHIKYVDVTVNTTGDAERFTLRWTQATDTFTETSDPSGICTLGANSQSETLYTNTTRLSFNLTFTTGQSGDCDIFVKVTEDDNSERDYTYIGLIRFSYFNWVDEVYDFINSAFSQFGIIDYMASITVFLEELSTWFNTSLTRILTLLTQQFLIINAVFGWFTYWSGEMIDIVLQFSTYYHEFLDGTSAWSDALVPWWEFFMGFADAFPLFGFIWWIGSLSTRGRQTVGGALQVIINDMNTAIGLFSYFFGIFSFVANTIIDRVYGLFDAIP